VGEHHDSDLERAFGGLTKITIERIFILNQKEASLFSPSGINCEPCAIIRATTLSEHIKNNGFVPLVNFSDFVSMSCHVFDDTWETGCNAFVLPQAEEIKKFVDEWKGRIRTLVVSCDAGKSRSAALAISIARYIGRNDIADSIIYNERYQPNLWVRQLMGQVLGVEMTKQESQELYEKLWKPAE
jgi:protein-tyrosine phosphatase